MLYRHLVSVSSLISDRQIVQVTMYGTTDTRIDKQQRVVYSKEDLLLHQEWPAACPEDTQKELRRKRRGT